MGIELSMDDFDRISERTPLICDLKPGGNYVATDYQNAGGSRLLAKRLLDAGLIDGSAPNITGTHPRRRSRARRRDSRPDGHSAV